MEIETSSTPRGASKHHTLRPSLSADDIRAALPGVVERGASGDGKADHIFFFRADGKECGIWRWHGREWSASGPREVFAKLGLLSH
ncbi:hypothetical protein O9X98_14960 [Agrobacterium salinitolerans]|nr:hypothetical protein [Agrobacterium salinitolerans]